MGFDGKRQGMKSAGVRVCKLWPFKNKNKIKSLL